MALVDYDGDCCALRAVLLFVIPSSKIGHRIFNFALQTVPLCEIQTITKAMIKEVLEAGKVDVAVFCAYAQKALRELGQTRAVSTLVDTRVIPMSNRAAPWTMEASTEA